MILHSYVKTCHDDVSQTRMATFADILLSYLSLIVTDAYLCPLHNLKTVCNIIMILQLCRTGHDDVSRTRMTTLAFIPAELFPLDGFRCSFVSTP